MRNRYVMSLFTLGAVAVLLLSMAPAADAELICKKFRPSGPKVCYEASTGSVNCLAIAQGVAATLARECDAFTGEGECYIVVKCSIFGTIHPDDAKRKDPEPDYSYCGQITDGQFPGGTDYFPFPFGEEVFPNCADACYIKGEGKCYNPHLHFEENGTAYIGGPLTSNSATATCDSGGTCTSHATVETDQEDICPNPHWTPEGFYPGEFYGVLSFCPGNYEIYPENPLGVYDDCDGNAQPYLGQCCTNTRRNEDGTCFKPFQANQPTEGQPGYIHTFCKWPAACDAPGDPLDCYDDITGEINEDVPYDCQDCEDIDCTDPYA